MRKTRDNCGLAVRGYSRETQESATNKRRRWRVLLACAWAVVLLCSIPHQSNANYNPPICLPSNAPPLPSVGEEVDTVMYFTNGKTIKCTITEPWYCGGYVRLVEGSHPASFYTVNPKDPYLVQLVRWDFGVIPNVGYGYRINVTTAVVSSSPAPSYTPNLDIGDPKCNQGPLN